MFSPTYYKRCRCKRSLYDDNGDPVLDGDGTPKTADLEGNCPNLKKRDHGTWYFFLELEPGPNGKRRRVRRGGFATKDDAKKRAAEVYKEADGGTDVLSKETFAEYLTRWLQGKRRLARTTKHGYEDHIHRYLIPHLGHIKRRDLRAHHIDRMYEAIHKENAERLLHTAKITELKENCATRKEAWQQARGTQERRAARRAWIDANIALKDGRKGLRKITGAATQHRINATLSSALTDGVKKEHFTKNFAALVELPPAKRPKALVWTDKRVEQWRKTTERPSPVMVWTPKQTGHFLDQMLTDRLYPLWHIFVFLGLRRGEACALPWSEIDLDNGWVHISAQIVEVAYKTYGEEPKADSVRTISLSAETVTVLRQWQQDQDAERQTWSGQAAWVESGHVFTQENGEPYHPDWFSRRFARLIALHDMPPVRLHDLRHGSATLALLAGNDIKVVQERLGHSSRQITSDTYTTVLPELMRSEAESTMSVVPRAQRRGPTHGQEEGPQDDESSHTDQGGRARQSGDSASGEGRGASE